MLSTQQHKQIKPGTNPYCIPFETLAPLAYVESETVETALKTACCISLVTVCLHTPKTLLLLPGLTYIILLLDFLALLIFTSDVILRVKHEGKVCPPLSSPIGIFSPVGGSSRTVGVSSTCLCCVSTGPAGVSTSTS